MARRNAIGRLLMLDRQWRGRRQRRVPTPMSVGADKAYDTHGFVHTVREWDVRPHVAQNVNRSGGSAIDSRTTRHESYQVSQRKRPLIEKAFGWMKQTAGMRKTKLRGLAKVSWQFLMTAAAFSLWRLPKIQAAEVSLKRRKRRLSTRDSVQSHRGTAFFHSFSNENLPTGHCPARGECLFQQVLKERMSKLRILGFWMPKAAGRLFCGRSRP